MPTGSAMKDRPQEIESNTVLEPSSSPTAKNILDSSIKAKLMATVPTTDSKRR